MPITVRPQKAIRDIFTTFAHVQSNGTINDVIEFCHLTKAIVCGRAETTTHFNLKKFNLN